MNSMSLSAERTAMDGPAALERLLARRSVATLEEPAPAGRDLERILEAGLRAPDHGRLKPWRFVVIRGEGKSRFAECLAQATLKRDVTLQAASDRVRAWALRTPLLIAVGAQVKPDVPFPEIEQVLSAGAAAMNMMNAVHLLGYGGIWVTGANAYDPSVNALLGFTAPSRLVGFLAIGTPRSAPVAERPRLADYVSEFLAN